MKENILIIAHHFPPYSPSYGQIASVSSLVNTLSNSYNVKIVCASGKIEFGYYGIKTPDNVSINCIYDKNAYRKHLQYSPQGSVYNRLQEIYLRFGLLKTIGRIIHTIKMRILIDKSELTFLPGALKKSIDIINKFHVKKVIISVPPYPTTKLVYKLKNKFPSLKILLIFRDSWTLHSMKNNRDIASLRKRKIEKKAVENADLICFVTPSMKKKYDEYYGINQKSILITNGFDSPVMPKHFLTMNNSQLPLRIGYFGKAHIGNGTYFRDIYKFFSFLKENRDNFHQKIKFDYYGYFSGEYQKWQDSINFDFKGQIGYNEVTKKMVEYDCLMLYHSTTENAEEVYTGKLFEYINAMRPIIVLGPQEMKDAKTIIKDYKIGIYIDIDSPQEMYSKLEHLISLKKKGKIQSLFNESIDVRKFSRNSKNMEYLRVINDLN